MAAQSQKAFAAITAVVALAVPTDHMQHLEPSRPQALPAKCRQGCGWLKRHSLIRFKANG